MIKVVHFNFMFLWLTSFPFWKLYSNQFNQIDWGRPLAKRMNKRKMCVHSIIMKMVFQNMQHNTLLVYINCPVETDITFSRITAEKSIEQKNFQVWNKKWVRSMEKFVATFYIVFRAWTWLPCRLNHFAELKSNNWMPTSWIYFQTISYD